MRRARAGLHSWSRAAMRLFAQLVLARIIEPVSKLHNAPVLEEAGTTRCRMRRPEPVGW
jgi:hypothetical protein